MMTILVVFLELSRGVKRLSCRRRIVLRQKRVVRIHTPRRSWAHLVLAAGVLFASSAIDGRLPVSAAPLLFEDFASDPIVAGHAAAIGTGTPADRFAYTTGNLTAHYDSGQDTALLSWPLGTTLSTADDFRFEVDFVIQSDTFVAQADTNPFAQMSFGLANSSTTGLSRLVDAMDIVMIDYFPSESTQFGGLPAIGPVMVRSPGAGSVTSVIEYPFGEEAGLDDESMDGDPEERPPLDTPLTAVFVHEAASRTMRIWIDAPGGRLAINQFGFTDVAGTGDGGGPDDDVTTIEHKLPPCYPLSVDRFALALWDLGGSTVVADVEFSRLAVYDDLVGTVPGDMNGDGVLSPADVGPFVLALTNRPLYESTYPLVDVARAGDVDGSGTFDLGDVAALNASLLGSTAGANVPEPASGMLLVVGCLSLVASCRLSVASSRDATRCGSPMSKVQRSKLTVG